MNTKTRGGCDRSQCLLEVAEHPARLRCQAHFYYALETNLKWNTLIVKMVDLYQSSSTGRVRMLNSGNLNTPWYWEHRSQGQSNYFATLFFCFCLICFVLDLIIFSLNFFSLKCLSASLSPANHSFVNIQVKGHQLQEILSFPGVSWTNLTGTSCYWSIFWLAAHHHRTWLTLIW